MQRNEIVLSGFGGQGIILAGNIVGKAAVIYYDKNATLTEDYGPEARGGACRAQLVISDVPISYPYVEDPGVLVAMSQEAYTKYSQGLRSDALLLYDADLVRPDNPPVKKVYGIPSTRFATELGRAAVANIVMLGFLSALSDIIPVDAMKQSMLTSVPKGTEELNTKAFELGYSYGKEQIKVPAKRKK